MLHRRAESTANENEGLSTTSAVHRSNNPHCYLLLSLNERDGWFSDQKLVQDQKQVGKILPLPRAIACNGSSLRMSLVVLWNHGSLVLQYMVG